MENNLSLNTSNIINLEEISCLTSYDIFLEFIKNNELFDKLLNTYKIDLTPLQVSTIKNILSSSNINENFNNLIRNINQIFSDNKIDLHDIPIIIKIVNENFNFKDQNIIMNITKDDIINIIKIIILILQETKIIIINNVDLLFILKIINSSLYLLDLNIEINTKKFNCFCFNV